MNGVQKRKMQPQSHQKPFFFGKRRFECQSIVQHSFHQSLSNHRSRRLQKRLKGQAKRHELYIICLHEQNILQSFQAKRKLDISDISNFLLFHIHYFSGNWDLVGNNTPIFFIRDPILFPSFIHTQKRNPATHLKDPDAMWDFITLRPETTHQVHYRIFL